MDSLRELPSVVHGNFFFFDHPCSMWKSQAGGGNYTTAATPAAAVTTPDLSPTVPQENS